MHLQLHRLRKQLRDRRVLPLIGIFLASGFLVLEGVDQLIGHGLLPEFMYPIAVVFYIFGIPGTTIIAWFHGQKGPQRPRALEVWMHGFMLIGALGISYGLIRGRPSSVSTDALAVTTTISRFDRVAIEEVLAGYSMALGNGDWSRAAEYTSTDAVWIPPNEPAEVGRKRVFDWVAEASPTTGDHRFSIHGLNGGGGLAYVRGRCDHGIAEANLFLFVLRRHEGDQWRIIVEMWDEMLAVDG